MYAKKMQCDCKLGIYEERISQVTERSNSSRSTNAFAPSKRTKIVAMNFSVNPRIH